MHVNSGVLPGGGQLPKLWAAGKFSSYQKNFVQNAKFVAEKPFFGNFGAKLQF